MGKSNTLRIVITGCNGQLGKELAGHFPKAIALSKELLDIADSKKVEAYNWSSVDVIINAAAYVNADYSETPEGRLVTWQVNAVGVKNLAKVAIENNIHLIHISSEYVFDGKVENHKEDEPFSPLSVYGQTKAAGDIVASLVLKHHILRTSWVVGDGHNFIKTMKNLADMRIDPKVVDDQFGRLTFTSELARAIDYIIENDIPVGTYNLSNSGTIRSWAEIAALTFELAGHDKNRVAFISTEEYRQNKRPFAPRPTHSDLDLGKIKAAGFKSTDYEPLLENYIHNLRTVE